MDTNVIESPARLTDFARSQAQAEASTWSAMVSHYESELRRIDALDSPMQRLTERAMVALEIGQALGLSEHQVHARMAMANRLMDHAPLTWLAFSAGRLDAARVQEVARTLDRLERDESRLRLDQSVVAYAESHTVAELRAWLRRFVTRVEADLALERAEQARDARYVQVVHVEDSMAWISAYVPSHVAAALEKRLMREARALGSDDPRTQAQRRADLFACWLTTSDATETHLVSDVAVTIEADVLTGLTDGFAASPDGEWQVPSSWVLDHVATDDTFWHRVLINPITRDVLAHEYVGRFAPAVLAKAIQFRDGVCRAPGCRKPADQCDLDHREPWPAGATSGQNMWALCRRHHCLKGHRVLHWVLPSGRTIAATPTQHTP